MRKPATSELGSTDEELLKSVEPQLKLHLEGADRESSPLRRGGERRVPTMGVSANQGLLSRLRTTDEEGDAGARKLM